MARVFVLILAAAHAWAPESRLVDRSKYASSNYATGDGKRLISDAPPSSSLVAATAPLVIGAAAAVMGAAYAAALRFALKLWQRAPAPWAIPCATAAGGAVVGALARRAPAFGVAGYIAAARGARPFPEARTHLAPFLLTSLATTAFGFSVGPEAPMVVAGAMLGAAMGRRVGGRERDAALAGAAGALTSFIDMPVAGAIFVVELLAPGAGLADDALPAAILATVGASLAGAALAPHRPVGGHFDWGAVARPPRWAYAAVAVPVGVAGAAVGELFVRGVAALRRPLGRVPRPRVAAGLAVGLLGILYPQTLFWGETSLQNVVDGQASASVAPHGLLVPAALTTRAVVDVARPLTAAGAFQVGIAKLAAIAVAVAGGFPGGVIFPLFFAAGALARGVSPLAPVVMCAMAAVQASVTRTPLATVLMLALSARASDLAALAPLCAVSAYVAVWTVRARGAPTFFAYGA